MTDALERIDRYVDGLLTAQETLELFVWAKSGPDAAGTLLKRVYMHCRTREVLRRQDVQKLFAPSNCEVSEDVFVDADVMEEVVRQARLSEARAAAERRDEENARADETETRLAMLGMYVQPPAAAPVRHIVIPKFVLYGAIAASVALVLAGVWRFMTPLTPTAPPVVANPPVERRDPVVIAEPPAPVLAVLDRAHDALWEGASGAMTAGTQLHDQTLELKRGAAQLTFSDGATVVLEAPARIHLESSNRARLERGRLFAQVPASAVGFTIDTPATRVVDLGTAFSVNVGADVNVADVCVFSGLVRAGLVTESGRIEQLHPIVADQALRFDANRQVIEPIAVRSDVFLSSWHDVLVKPEVHGQATFTRVAPGSVRHREWVTGRSLRLFLERSGVTLEADQPVTVNRPGTFVWFEDDRLVPAGARVDSFLLHFEPFAEKPETFARVTGRVRFQRRIVGIIASDDALTASDARFGHPEVIYPSADESRLRGLDFPDRTEISDRIVVEEDGHTLSFSIAAVEFDQMRVLTESASEE